MKNKIYIFGVLIVTMFSINGCSWTPYADDFSCKKGLKEGACDSVTNNYLASLKINQTETEKVENNYKYNSLKTVEDIEDYCNFLVTNDDCILESKCKEKEAATYDECFEKQVNILINKNVSTNKKEINHLEELLYYENLENQRILQNNQLKGN